MKRLAAFLSAMALCAAYAAPASAQDGAGLYEPFPEPSGPEVSRAFIGELPTPGPRLANKLSGAELELGARVPAGDLPAGFGLPARAASGPAERANPAAELGTSAGWLAAATLVVLCGATALRLVRT